jgi:alpha-tubulin suppressor-like RCC1 family protein
MKLLRLKNLKSNFQSMRYNATTVSYKKIKHEIYSFGYQPDLKDTDEDPAPSRELLEPKIVPGYEGFPVRMITSAYSHAMFVSEDNKVFGWGNNDYGQLGIPFMNKHEVSYPIQLRTLSNVKASKVATGRCHSVMLSDEGHVFTFGHQEFGQLGNGVINKDQISEVPTRVDSLLKQKVVDISCGLDHTVALTDKSELYAWGFNQEGQCGTGTAKDLDTPERIPGIKKRVVKLFGGLDYTCAVTEEGDFYTWGAGEGLQMANGEKDIKMKPILSGIQGEKITLMACSGASVIALTESNLIYSWGLGMTGRLGHGDEVDCPFPKSITFFENLQKKIVQITGRGGHYFVLTEDGSLYGWGFGAGGRLGTCDEENQYTPIPINYFKGRKIICIGTGVDNSQVVVEAE